MRIVSPEEAARRQAELKAKKVAEAAKPQRTPSASSSTSSPVPKMKGPKIINPEAAKKLREAAGIKDALLVTKRLPDKYKCPFFLRALGYYYLQAKYAEEKDAEESDNDGITDEAGEKPQKWDSSFVDKRSYFVDSTNDSMFPYRMRIADFLGVKEKPTENDTTTTDGEPNNGEINPEAVEPQQFTMAIEAVRIDHNIETTPEQLADFEEQKHEWEERNGTKWSDLEKEENQLQPGEMRFDPTGVDSVMDSDLRHLLERLTNPEFPWEKLNHAMNTCMAYAPRELSRAEIADWQHLYTTLQKFIADPSRMDTFNPQNRNMVYGLRQTLNNLVMWALTIDYRWNVPIVDEIMKGMGLDELSLCCRDSRTPKQIYEFTLVMKPEALVQKLIQGRVKRRELRDKYYTDKGAGISVEKVTDTIKNFAISVDDNGKAVAGRQE